MSTFLIKQLDTSNRRHVTPTVGKLTLTENLMKYSEQTTCLVKVYREDIGTEIEDEYSQDVTTAYKRDSIEGCEVFYNSQEDHWTLLIAGANFGLSQHFETKGEALQLMEKILDWLC